MSLKDNWTTDAAGNPVDWTQPPYMQPGSGLLQLLLEGEDPATVPSATFRKRAIEYLAIVRKRSKGHTTQKPEHSHTCHWPGCEAEVAPSMWGCKPHWTRLPQSIKQEILEHYRAGQDVDKRPTVDYLRAARNAVAWAANQTKRSKTR